MEEKGTVLALGMFDGVHIGHRKLIETAHDIAASLGVSTTVYTFSNHPAQILRGSVSLLSDNRERERLLKQAGADNVFMEPFTEELCAMQPQAFLEHLNTLFRIKGIVCGFNYTYGAHGSGNPDSLRQYGKDAGIPVEVIGHCDALGAPVSSTRIRNMLISGDIDSALLLLGHPFYFSGSVSECTPEGGYEIKVDPNLAVPYPAGYSAYEVDTGIKGTLKSANGIWTFYPKTGTVPNGHVSLLVSGVLK